MLADMQLMITFAPESGRSSVRLEYASGGRVVAGSNPVTPTAENEGVKINILTPFFWFLQQIYNIFSATTCLLEKPRDFDPFGQTEWSPLATIWLTL